MATFPYIPTTVLPSPTDNDLFYIFLQSEPALASSRLIALNISNPLSSTNLPYSTITPSLPFLDGSQNTAYIPAIDGDENILVYTGNCTYGTKESNLWQFTATHKGPQVNGTWKEMDLLSVEVNDLNGLDGANYLAAAIAFSPTTNTTSEMYIFGGMCPNATDLNANSWQEAANYSNTMLTIQSEQVSSNSNLSYDLGMSTSRGPPIPEAGFTITALQPTYFESGDSNDTKSQNQNFILLGGHTQKAFINMSQVALFSLPEQSWSFSPVDPPTANPNTDLAVRNQASIDSRSGHTSVLTSDGKKIVVFGGWVGDVTTSANPQLAILELGEGYGGSGDWQWDIPSQTGSNFVDGTGIYGHGAAMLPGDVMMIVGGYQISGSIGSKRKRASLSFSSKSYFFNTTSLAWIDNYVHPTVVANHGLSNNTGDGSDTASKRTGLGVGLTLGILATVVLVVLYFWYSRRLKRRRNLRRDELRDLASAVHHHRVQDQSGSPERTAEMSSVHWPPDTSRSPWAVGKSGQFRSGHGEPEAERTGLLFEVPSPTRGLRKSLHSRSGYQPTPRYDSGRRSPMGFSTIHPIDEREEYDEGIADENQSGQQEMMQREDYNILSNVPVLNPFHDPSDGSRSPSPQSPQDREMEIRNWVNDWTAAEALLHHNTERLSPEKTDRTSSTLSDQSARSGLSSHSIQHSIGTISRSISQRSAALFNSSAFRSTNDSAPLDRSGSARRYPPEHRRSQSLTLYPTPYRVTSSDTFTAAGPSLSRLQAEGEALLGDYPGPRDQMLTRSPTRARGWMGSVRRALTGVEWRNSITPENNASVSSSPTKMSYNGGELPRRAASTGAILWPKRQGARDWDAEGRGQRAEPNGAHGNDHDDEDWDVESAVERRVVQVMFTVPKEKLRVVNKGPEGDGESVLSAEAKDAGDGSEGLDKGKGKLKG